MRTPLTLIQVRACTYMNVCMCVDNKRRPSDFCLLVGAKCYCHSRRNVEGDLN